MKIIVPKITLWHILLCIAILVFLIWWWFDKQIDSINTQIEFLHQ